MNGDNKNYVLYPVKHFIEEYKKKNKVRLHMPGHKGAFGYDGDITEVTGADSLYEANGIIADSENRATELFGSWKTFYGTEGSSQMIKAMCYLAMQHYYNLHPEKSGERPTILATRNAHKSFIMAAMLLGFNIQWIMPNRSAYSLCRCDISSGELDEYLRDYGSLANVSAVYITSPDYLGNILDVEGIAKVTHRYDLPLMVDNAHGAYLKFMGNIHPLDLGADIVSDSAHKTLPVLTGGAYLHISKSSIFIKNKKATKYEEDVRRALLMFGSTSPSYTIMESLDAAIGRISESEYLVTAKRVEDLKSRLSKMGYTISKSEPLKITIDFSESKTDGDSIISLLSEHGIECEYADPDYLVTMWSPYNEYPRDYELFAEVMDGLSKDIHSVGEKEARDNLIFKLPEVRFQPYELMYHPYETVEVSDKLNGKVVEDTVVSCPPAVSPVVAGEVLDENLIKILEYYKVKTINILK